MLQGVRTKNPSCSAFLIFEPKRYFVYFCESYYKHKVDY